MTSGSYRENWARAASLAAIVTCGKPQEGVVVAVGKGKILDDGTRQNMEVKAGDHILFGKYSGTDIKVEGDEYLILREEEVLGIL